MKAGDEQNSEWLPKDHVFSSARNGVQLLEGGEKEERDRERRGGTMERKKGKLGEQKGAKGM